MEIGIPLDRYSGNLPYGRIGIEGDKYYLLRSPKPFTVRKDRERFPECIKNTLGKSIITINGRDWIKICSITDFEPNYFVTVLRNITSCVYDPALQILAGKQNDPDVRDKNDSALQIQAGKQNDPDIRGKIENHAMKRCMKYYSDEGYDVEDVSASKPYDIVIRKDGQEKLVEVKGLQTALIEDDEIANISIILTRNEVEISKRRSEEMILFIVHSIQLDENRDVVKNSGSNCIIHPWEVKEDQLTPISYNYNVIIKK
ncbi:MAG: DUF3883 domain-containing protein [bacterium]